MARLRYRIECVTDSKYEHEWRHSSESVPTLCPVNPAHTINSNNIVVTERKNDVNAEAKMAMEPDGLTVISAATTLDKKIRSYVCFDVTVADQDVTLPADVDSYDGQLLKISVVSTSLFKITIQTTNTSMLNPLIIDPRDTVDFIYDGNMWMHQGRLTSMAGYASNGSLYMEDNSTATSISAVGTPAKAAGTTTAGTLDNFTHTNNRLTYTAVDTRRFSVFVDTTLQAASADQNAGIIIFKNGTQVFAPNTTTVGDIATKRGNNAASALVSLATNDYIEVFLVNDTSSDNLTAVHMNMVISDAQATKGDTGAQIDVGYAESEGESTTTSTSPQEKVSMTFSAEAGDYIIEWSAEISSTDSGALVETQVQRDDVETIHDAGSHPDTNASLGWGTVSGFKKLTLADGNPVFDLDYSTSSATKTVKIRKARLRAIKL